MVRSFLQLHPLVLTHFALGSALLRQRGSQPREIADACASSTQRSASTGASAVPSMRSQAPTRLDFDDHRRASTPHRRHGDGEYRP